MRFLYNTYPSSVGQILLVWDQDGAVRALDFEDYDQRMHRLLTLHYGIYSLETEALPKPIKHALDLYFRGVHSALDTIATATGGTDFQRALWKALRGIPAGSTTTYGKLAAALGRPTASRAIGAANGANPIAIIVPCHRVVGSNGKLTGYAGGLKRKAWLLAHENGLPSDG